MQKIPKRIQTSDVIEAKCWYPTIVGNYSKWFPGSHRVIKDSKISWMFSKICFWILHPWISQWKDLLFKSKLSICSSRSKMNNSNFPMATCQLSLCKNSWPLKVVFFLPETLFGIIIIKMFNSVIIMLILIFEENINQLLAPKTSGFF